MSRDEQMAFFMGLFKTVSAARIAKSTGYSDSAVSQVKNRKYQGDEGIFLAKVAHVFGRWDCPALGQDVGYEQCRAEAEKPYSAGRVKQWAVCQKCERNKP